MATLEMPLLGLLAPDTSGSVYPSMLDQELALTNVKKVPCYVWAFPTGADIGFEGIFTLPQNYAGTPVLVIRGFIDGTPANTLAFAAQQIAVAASDTGDVAYEAEDTASNGTWTGYADEDAYELTITLTPTVAWSAGKQVFLKVVRDDSVDTQTINFLVTGIALRYSDT